MAVGMQNMRQYDEEMKVQMMSVCFNWCGVSVPRFLKCWLIYLDLD